MGEAAIATEAVGHARAARPQAILMDIRMPVLDGVAATQQIATRLGVGPANARTHVSGLPARLDARDRPQLVTAYEPGLVVPGG